VSDDNFISRWSKRKHAAKREDVATAKVIPARADVVPARADVVPAPADVVPAKAGTQPPVEAKPLPPLESLTPESDFTAFMGSDVDPGLRRAALKTLFKDPRFNVMDGMDVYIDDYSKFEPIPEGWAEKMNQFARLGDYRPPAPPEEIPPPPPPAEKVELEQPLAAALPKPSADTSEPGLPLPESKES
jgi:hypothetical protein